MFQIKKKILSSKSKDNKRDDNEDDNEDIGFQITQSAIAILLTNYVVLNYFLGNKNNIWITISTQIVYFWILAPLFGVNVIQGRSSYFFIH